ncbi:uncharacterized protein LOC105444386 [Strongylocentrotus purpuratus]|uniref:NACHT domain-containing protein n=1 Tax=Strongylocentrotus purpuratus TaxID=7668 RepID=A0A7M7T2Q1_STRPU|nr:uncharacterized protein LOC105444386 [Strongylocentrotus purpuratus]
MKPWDQSDYAEFEDMHTVVTMSKKDARGQNTKTKEILKGSVAEIFSTTVNGRLPARILISAPAGRGKTTAVAKMAYDWVHREKGSALEHLPLLFVVKFRNTSQLTSIGEAIKSQLLSDVADLTPEVLESFIRENQGICHIILDGLDEYAGISPSKQSSESNIVSVIRWEEFPECRVLVTTRPHLDNFFNQAELPRVYTKMWIEGFSRERSREYIDKFFASTSIHYSTHGHGLKVYLDDQALMNEVVKTPLFCLMVCHLWSEGLLNNTETATQTKLLDSVNVFLMHHANARLKSRVKITPKKLRKIISQLGEVALTGLLDDAKKLVFTPHDFRKVPTILDRACELGIVSKKTVHITCLPQSIETTSTTIEFYHKLAQEHSAGKFLADQTHHFLLRLKISELDRVLRKIKANIGDYENLIRFAAGTDNSLCIRIMEALLSNNFLDESERYRILLDCSSETMGAEGNVSSLVRRCVTAQSMMLKSPTVYTIVGMKNLPTQLKREVRTVHFEGSTLNNDVTNGLWSCLGSFSMLHTLTISDSSISFPPSPPELPSVKKLSAERLTSQSYERVLSSVPGVREIDVSIDVAELEMSNTFEITTASRPMGQTRARDEQLFVHIRLHAWPALTTDRKIDSGESIARLNLLFGDQTRNQQRLHVYGVKGRDEETLVDLFVKTKQLTPSNLGSGGGSVIDGDAVQNTRLEIQQCQLSTEMTDKLWSCLRSFTPLNQLSISDSSLSFPPSPPELPSVQKLSAERVTTHSYEGLLSSLPGLRDIEIKKCQLSTEMTARMWSCLRSFTSLKHLTISDSSLSFPPSPPELTSVTKLSVKRATLQSYEGLLLSLPSLRDIYITIDDAERDISQITADLRLTGGQQLTQMEIRAPSSLPPELNSVSRKTMKELSLLIKAQTKNMQELYVSGVKCTDEEDLIHLIGSCRYVKTMSKVWLEGCGSTAGGRLESHLTRLHTGTLNVFLVHLSISDDYGTHYLVKMTCCIPVIPRGMYQPIVC